MRSSEVLLLGALTAREGSLAGYTSLPPRPLTARPLGVTPRNAAMLGPRSDVLIRDVEKESAASCGKAAAQKGDLRSPRGVQSPQRSDAAARRGESHPRARTVLSNDWALAAKAEVAEADEWLQHAVGGRVEIVTEGTPGVQGMLLGPAASEGNWTVAPERGTPPREVQAAALRRVAPVKGDLARTVLGSATGFCGEVLSIDRSVAVVRGGGTPGARVRVLPLDTLCAVVG